MVSGRPSGWRSSSRTAWSGVRASRAAPPLKTLDKDGRLEEYLTLEYADKAIVSRITNRILKPAPYSQI